MSDAQPPGNYNYNPAPTGGPAGYAPAQDPGRTLGIVGLVLAIIANVVGLVISIIAFVKSRKAGYKNGIALAGIIVGGALTLAGIAVAIIVFAVVGNVVDKCHDLGPGVHQVGGVTYTCG